MKKIILSLVFVLATGAMMNANSLSKEVTIESNSFKEKLTTVTNSIEISNEVAVPGCTNFGAEVFASAIEAGYSIRDSWDLGIAAMNICNALVLIGSYL